MFCGVVRQFDCVERSLGARGRPLGPSALGHGRARAGRAGRWEGSVGEGQPGAVGGSPCLRMTRHTLGWNFKSESFQTI